MRNKAVKEMAIAAIFIALIAVATFVPYVGYITIPPISITIIHIFVLIAALLFGWKQGLIAGVAFGVFSLIKASTQPVGTPDYVFINPLISILPRVIFGVVSGLLFDLEEKINNVKKRSVVYVLTCIGMTVIHTVMVLTMFYLFQDIMEVTDTFSAIIQGSFTLNCLVESTSAAILAPAIALAVSKAKPSYSAYKTNEVSNNEKD